MLTRKQVFIGVLQTLPKQSSCQGRSSKSCVGVGSFYLLKQFVSPLDTLTASGHEAAQNGKRTERIKRWLYWWNCVAAICIPAPKPKWSRFASGKVPSTNPGVRNTSFLPSNVLPDQKVEFCSTIGQIFPLILY